MNNMEKDKTLEQLFESFNPDLGSSDAFMSSLTRKLEAVEYIKQMQEAQKLRYKRALLVAFGAGMVASLVLIAVILLLPTMAPVLSLHAAPFAFFESNGRIIILIFLSLVAGTSIIGLSANQANTSLSWLFGTRKANTPTHA